MAANEEALREAVDRYRPLRQPDFGALQLRALRARGLRAGGRYDAACGDRQSAAGAHRPPQTQSVRRSAP